MNFMNFHVLRRSEDLNEVLDSEYSFKAKLFIQKMFFKVSLQLLLNLSYGSQKGGRYQPFSSADAVIAKGELADRETTVDGKSFISGFYG